METTLLQRELLDGQIAITTACVDATTNILERCGLLLKAVLEIPQLSLESFGHVSRTIVSTSVTYSLSAATLMRESFDPRFGPGTLSKANVPAPTLSPKGGPRRTRAIAAA
jgi:hypothetical protein